MAGTICVLAGELSRYSNFHASFTRLEKPPDTYIDWVIGKGIVEGLNQSVHHFLTEDGGDWWFLMADDHTFDPDLLLRLLARRVPIVAPLYSQRAKPFHPHIYSASTAGDAAIYQYTWKHLQEETGLYKLNARESCGSAGMLIQREVFLAMGDTAWWCNRPDLPYSEDLYFCERVRKLGYEVHVDLDTRLGHTFVATAIPVRTEAGDWVVAIQAGEKSIVYIRY